MLSLLCSFCCAECINIIIIIIILAIVQGGIFRIDINIPSDYPFSPPKMKFETKGMNMIHFLLFFSCVYIISRPL